MNAFLIISLATLSLGANIDPIKYLSDYGYLPTNNEYARVGSLGNLGDAIINFQKFAHLPQTGFLDDVTLKMMKQPRCGLKDVITGNFDMQVRKKRYVSTSRYWQNRLVTYGYENYNADLGLTKTIEIIKKAFDMWSNVTNLLFEEVTGSKIWSATMRIRFQRATHNCTMVFDGPGGILAHAFFPPDGRIHFDEDEEFTDGENRGWNLLWVAAHEIGHALGLLHTSVIGSVMYPIYQGYKPDFRLHADDVGSVQALYGCRNANINPVPIPRDSAPHNGLLMERWSNIQGEGIHHIEPNVCKYPHQPDSARILRTFEAPSNNGDSFATRIRGYIIPEKTAMYRFYMCADHSAKLYLSMSKDQRDKQMIISVQSPTSKDFRQCKKDPTERFLIAGLLYYIEAIHKDSSGDDFLKVGLENLNDRVISPISFQNAKWALRDTDISLIICKGRFETLTCPYATEISIKKASYGFSIDNFDTFRQIMGTCNVGEGTDPPKENGDCVAKSSLRVIRAACHGKQQCTLYAHDSVFTDHCGMTVYSVIDVTYRCVARGTATFPTTKPSTPRLTTKELCQDLMPICQAMKDNGDCKLPDTRKVWCRKTCGECV